MLGFSTKRGVRQFERLRAVNTATNTNNWADRGVDGGRRDVLLDVLQTGATEAEHAREGARADRPQPRAGSGARA